ncbi:MAG: ROK family protein [Clostridium sp.]|uniref:ROK family protein n=1 Tax=Clostridium sp. TaxID=1506 RepID=UPI002913915A|nr:ROK family protein [Clostridium sp.]MDU4426644.1 ROK family protein [Clostridium sp.]MDU7460948.1 ROK family protein [Clostridium sp.]
MGRYLGIDVGGTEIKYGIFDENGNEFIEESGSVKSVRDDLDKIIDILSRIIKSAKEIDGVGISIPGGVDNENGVIIEGGAIPVLAGVDLIGILNEKTGLNVAIENDANCVVLAEKWIGNGKDCSSFVCMTIGTGIGGGMFINNKIHVGKNFFAGEFGYIIIEEFEDYNNIPTLSFSSATEPLLKQVALAKEMKFEDINGLKVFEMIENGDEVVIEAYRKWLRKLCIGINNVGFSIDPEKFLIGGGVSGAPRLIPDIKEELRKINPYTESWKIETCKHFNSSGKIGDVYNYLVRNDLV